MKVRTAWAQDGPPTAAMTWRYPAEAKYDFPAAAINEVLAAFYNDEREALNNPYLFIARDVKHQIIGLVITDNEGVELDQLDMNALFAATVDAGLLSDTLPRIARSIEGDTFAIAWPFPSGHVFPVDVINALLAALYDAHGRPFIYPVFDGVARGRNELDELRQVGLLISPLRDLPGDPSENWRQLRADFRTIFADDETHPIDAPWGEKEWDLE
jgi:hypothetical protein